jgi:hypothetical protein
MAEGKRFREFVEKTLGCGCPEEVLSHITYVPEGESGGVRLSGRLNAGGRLLVYLAEISDDFAERLPRLIESGKQERDEHGFNRLRIVLICSGRSRKEDAVSGVFEKQNRDEKIHLHFVTREELPSL